MQKERLKYLLEKYAANRLSELELTELENWYQELNYGTQSLEQWIADVQGEDVLGDLFYQNFEKRIGTAVKVNTFSMWRIVAAAAIIILVTSFGLYFYLNNGWINTNRSVSPDITRTVIKPGGNKAVLTLSNGKQIDLNDVENGQVAQTGGVRIRKTDEGQIFYQEATDKKYPGEKNTITTPKGGQYQIILSDGTHVWLNAASSLKYPTLFVGKERIVELTGEAYFEVSPNKKMPFLVISNRQKVKVLGTHFNIKAYSEDGLIKTTLLEGSVAVSSKQSKDATLLRPGEEAVFDGKTMLVRSTDVKEAVAWKNGYFLFKDEDIYSIMNQVSRWYDVEVIYTSKFENKRFGGYVSRAKKITDLLDIMEGTKGISFKIEGRRIKVMK